MHTATPEQHLLSELLLLLFPEQVIYELVLSTPAKERGVYKTLSSDHTVQEQPRKLPALAVWQRCGRKGENVTLDECTNSSTQ